MSEFESLKRFACSLDFYNQQESVDRVVATISDKVGIPITRLVRGREDLVHYIIDGSNLTRELATRNQNLENVIFNFLTGDNRLLIIGGDPGNGKSLLATDVRRFDQVYQSLDENLEHPLAFIPFDKARQFFFLKLSERLGYDIPLPKGASPEWMMEMVERAMMSTTFFVLDNYSKARVIVEAPLFNNRGENIVYEAERRNYGVQTVIMHSPDTFFEILDKGKRDVATSGQPEAMVKMRRIRLESITGDIELPVEAENQILKRHWETMLRGRRGVVVEWSPVEIRQAFEDTRKEFVAHDQKPDVLTPIPVGTFISHQYELMFDLLGGKKLEALFEGR